MATTNDPKDWVKDAEQVFKKSMEANKQMLEDASAAMGRLFSVGTKKEESSNGGDWGKLMSDWMKINMRYTENMINLGLDWSKSVADLLQSKAAEPAPAPTTEEAPSTARDAKPAPTNQTQEIVMAAYPGETVATSLHLQNSHPVAQSGRFEATKFRQEGTGRFSQISLHFDPEQFEIPTGQSVPAVLSMKVPESTTPSNYRCRVVVHGFEGAEFDLVLQVNAPAAEPVAAAPKKAAPKKKSATKKAKG